MNDQDIKDIKEVLDGPEFEGEIFFSTDGKHTVHAKASTPTGREAGLNWAFKAYERIVANLGTKADMWEKTINKGNGQKPAQQPQATPQVACSVCGGVAEFKQGTSKTGKPWKGYFCTVDKDHEPRWVK